MKEDRQRAILGIIASREIRTQGELQEALEQQGYQVTQATVSRDIREMRLTKVQAGDGTFRYAAIARNDSDPDVRYRNIFREGVISIDPAVSVLVIKTVPGMAMAVAAAVDHMDLPGIAGSIAGDDTIMCAVRTVSDVAPVLKELSDLLY